MRLFYLLKLTRDCVVVKGHTLENKKKTNTHSEEEGG